MYSSVTASTRGSCPLRQGSIPCYALDPRLKRYGSVSPFQGDGLGSTPSNRKNRSFGAAVSTTPFHGVDTSSILVKTKAKDGSSRAERLLVAKVILVRVQAFLASWTSSGLTTSCNLVSFGFCLFESSSAQTFMA